MYQSAENGSIPFGGDTPFTSRYSRIIRSRESVNSLSSTCMRAPSSIKAIAQKTSCASATRLFLTNMGRPFLNELSGQLIREQNKRWGRCRGHMRGLLRQRRQHCTVIEAENTEVD